MMASSPLLALAFVATLASFVPGALSAEDSCNPLRYVAPGSLFKKSASGLSIFRDVQFAMNVRAYIIRRCCSKQGRSEKFQSLAGFCIS